MALKRLHKRLTAPRQTDPVLRAFADHIYHYILVPSGRGAAHGGARFLSLSAGCFTYEPPVALHWISN
jgi:hypothetical protein